MKYLCHECGAKAVDSQECPPLNDVYICGPIPFKIDLSCERCQLVANCMLYPLDGEDVIRARLQAAAPDLLKALQEMVADMKAMSRDYQGGVTPFSSEDAEKLIAKILGDDHG